MVPSILSSAKNPSEVGVLSSPLNRRHTSAAVIHECHDMLHDARGFPLLPQEAAVQEY